MSRSLVFAALASLSSLSVLPSQSVPLVFEPNRGQAAAGCEFVARAAGATLQLRGGTAAIVRAGGVATSLTVVGASPAAQLQAEEPLPGHSTYLVGNDPTRWLHYVPHAGSLRATGVLPGIDLRWHGKAARLEYDFELAAHADPTVIRIQASEPVRIDERGRLVQGTGAPAILHDKPIAWQELATGRRRVEVAFVVLAPDQFGFAVGGYDASLPLTIDPILAFASYFGGAGDDNVADCEFDGQGNVVVCGSQGPDAYVAKLSADGSTLLWRTFVGGTNVEYVFNQALALDAGGRMFLSGSTGSADFPVTSNAYQTLVGGGQDGFLAVLAADGSHLEYATYFGGAGAEQFYGMAIHTNDQNEPIAYLTGNGQAGMPTTPNAYRQTCVASADAIVVCIAPGGAGAADLRYSSFLGTNGYDRGTAIAVDGLGHAHVTGSILQEYQGAPPFPVTANAFHAGPVPSNKTPVLTVRFYTRMATAGPTAGTLLYSTILENGNGVQTDDGGIALGADGRVYLCGGTGDTKYPVTATAYQATHRGAIDAYVTVIDPDLSGLASLIYSTLLGGTDYDAAPAIGWANGRIYLAGRSRVSTARRPVPFPTTVDAFQSAYAGGFDAFVSVLDITLPASQQLVYSTLFGGSLDESSLAITVSATGSILVGGSTLSGNLPVTAGALDMSYNGNRDGFVFRID